MPTPVEEDDVTTLLRQAALNADTHLNRAIDSIDHHFGEGFAAEHPELISVFIQIASIDHVGGIIAQQIRAGFDDIVQAIRATQYY